MNLEIGDLVGALDESNFTKLSTNQTGTVTECTSRDATWKWVTNITSTQNYSYSLCSDSVGNTYVAGCYMGTLTFHNADRSTGITLGYIDGTGMNSYVAKISSSGKWLWATQIVGIAYDYGLKVNVDMDGNGIVSGYFSGGDLSFYNMDQSIGSQLTSNASTNGFIGKITSGGVWIWSALIFGANPNDYQYISIDSNSNCYVSGIYTVPITFCHSNSKTSSTLPVAMGIDIYIGKIDSEGMWVWTLNISGVDATIPFKMDVGPEGDGYVTVVADTNPPMFYNSDGSSISTVLPVGSFVTVYVGKLSRNGFWISTPGMICSNSIGGIQGVKLDSKQNGYIVGLFDATDTLYYVDPAGNIDIILSTNGVGMYLFVAKIKPSGIWEWVSYIGTNPSSDNIDIYNQSMHVDNNGNSYIIGSYYQSMVFYNRDSTVGSQLDLSNGNPSAYIAKLNSQGHWIYSNKMISEVFGMDISLDSMSNIYVTGSYQSNPIVLFNSDASSPFNLSLEGTENTFVGKLKRDINLNSIIGIVQSNSVAFPSSVIVTNIFINLIPGYSYYINSMGKMTTNPIGNLKYIGIALTPTSMLARIK